MISSKITDSGIYILRRIVAGYGCINHLCVVCPIFEDCNKSIGSIKGSIHDTNIKLLAQNKLKAHDLSIIESVLLETDTIIHDNNKEML